MLWLLVAFAVAVVASGVVIGLRREVQRVRRLGQYTLQEKIGEGAMGIVYRAQHAMLRRPTAIKLLQPTRAGQKNLERFEREVQLTALLTHPNTVAIYDYGRTPDGMFYYAMEYLDGLDLEVLVRRYGAQPVGRVIHIVRQVCRALAEAHGIGVIHRDIKPANIILGVRGGDPDVAKVVDFGLVKALDMNDAAITMSLDAGPVLAGTPLYFSPESIASPDAADARSDLYALAAVAYYLVTGAPLFEGRTVMEICAQHLHAAPVSPSDRLGRALPAAFEALLLQALSKSPDERPRDARVFDAALQACEDLSPWTPEEASRWWNHYEAARSDALEASDRATGLETVDVDLSARP
jgi:serine/threonine-protein kinase